MLHDQRVVHEGDGVTQRAADRDDAFGDHGVALVGHGRGPDLAFGEGLADFVDLVVGEADDLGGDLGEAAADQPEHARIFNEAIPRRLPGDIGDPQAEPRHHPLVELEGAIPQRCLSADRADQAADEGARLELPEALVVAAGFGKPDRAFVAEGDWERLHRMGAPHHRRVLVLFGEGVQHAPDGLEVAHKDPVRLLELQHSPGVEHVLGGRPEVEKFAVAIGANRLQGAQRRHQGMIDLANARGDHLEVHVLDLGLAGNLVGCGLRNDAELGLGEGKRGFEVEPLLNAVLVVEDRAERLRAPHMLEQNGIEDTGGHAGHFTMLEKSILCPIMAGPASDRGRDVGAGHQGAAT